MRLSAAPLSTLYYGGNFLSHRLLALMLAVALCICSLAPPAFAEDAAETENQWVDPQLDPNAIPWDSSHPELLEEEMLVARSAILIEATTGEVLFEKNADEIMFPASTTKILTAYIALQMADFENDVVTVSQAAIDAVPPTYSKVPLSAGESVAIGDIITAMMVMSGNEAANAIAEFISGGIEQFAVLMNETAQMLGSSHDTHFANPSGAHDETHYTTARDLAIITQAAMEDERFRDIARMYQYDMPASNVRPARTLVGGTSILKPEDKYFYGDATGVKTGFTNPAGYCYVGSATRGGIELISVVLYTSRSGRWTDTKKLLEYGFTQVESISPESLYAESPRVIDVSGFSLEDSNHGELTLGIRAVDEEKDMIIVGNQEKIDLLRENFSEVSVINWTREFRAPINVGDVMGILTFYAENGSTADYELVATRSIAARENAPPTLEEIIAYTNADENPWPRFNWDYFVPPAALLILLTMLLRFIRRHRTKRAKAPDIKPVKKRYVR